MVACIQLPTIVEHYVFAAIRHAVVEADDEDGILCAYVPQAKGVIVYGADVHECAAELYARLEDWVESFLRQGHELPVIDGIDLNADASRLLTTYRSARNGKRAPNAVFETEEEFEAELERIPTP